MQTVTEHPNPAPHLPPEDWQLVIDPTRRMTPEDVAAAVGQKTQTVRQWIKDGAFGHKLHAVYAGGRVYTSLDHVQEFFAAVNQHAR